MDLCTSENLYKPVLWTEFDTTHEAGRLLLSTAASGVKVFGFDWAGACDINLYELPIVSLPTLNLIVSSLPCNDTTLELKINQTLLYLTTLVSIPPRPCILGNRNGYWLPSCMLDICGQISTFLCAVLLN